MFTLKSTVPEKILNECTLYTGKCKSDCSEFTDSAVISAVKLLKKGKNDGHKSLYSENIVHGPYLLFVFLSLLFTAMLRHCLRSKWHVTRYNGAHSKTYGHK